MEGRARGALCSDQMEAGGELDAEDSDGRRPREGEPIAVGGN